MESVLKREKVYEYFVHNCQKIFMLVFTSLKMRWNSKNYHLLVEKVKPHHKYCPGALGTCFSTELLLDAKVQNNGS